MYVRQHQGVRVCLVYSVSEAQAQTRRPGTASYLTALITAKVQCTHLRLIKQRVPRLELETRISQGFMGVTRRRGNTIATVYTTAAVISAPVTGIIIITTFIYVRQRPSYDEGLSLIYTAAFVLA